jgi:MinD superfamily P-loop ATPase
MVLTIASGKGGTGKTTLAVNLARAADSPVLLLDCDVEEPNAHLFLKPDITAVTPVYKPVPRVDEAKCTCCGTCAEVCAYHAITVVSTVVLVFDALCHGCGGCARLCPEGAISEVGQPIGVVEHGQAGHIEFAHGRLTVGEAMAGPVIKAVKRQMNGQPLVIIDAPPGTACPVVATLLGSDVCLLVTEPTPFGLHDLTLAVDVVRQLGIPFGVALNRADIGDQGVETYCQVEQIPILMRLPNDRRIAEAYSRGDMLVDALPEYRQPFQELLQRVMTQI